MDDYACEHARGFLMNHILKMYKTPHTCSSLIEKSGIENNLNHMEACSYMSIIMLAGISLMSAFHSMAMMVNELLGDYFRLFFAIHHMITKGQRAKQVPGIIALRSFCAMDAK
jgi:hypothetical protein